MTGIEKEINPSSLTSTHPTIPNQRIRWETLESTNIKIIIKTMSCNFIPKTKLFFLFVKSIWNKIGKSPLFCIFIYCIKDIFYFRIKNDLIMLLEYFFFTKYPFALLFSFWLLLYFIYFNFHFNSLVSVVGSFT